MSSLRHTALAYLLLVAAFAVVTKLLIAPSYLDWQAKRTNSFALQHEVSAAEAELARVEHARRALVSQMSSLLSAKKLVYAEHASAAGHRVQQITKSAFSAQGATISQLRPSDEMQSNGLSKSRLEISFSVASESLQPLLKALSKTVPSLHIDLVSLRSTPGLLDGARAAKPINLEGSMNVEMWYLDKSTINQGSLLASDINGLSQRSLNSTEQAQASIAVASEPNVLAGLFDQNTRLRFLAPSLDHYRLAAITVSQNSRIAVIANTLDGETRRLRQGELLDVWRIESIDSNRVSLSFADRTDVLNLNR